MKVTFLGTGTSSGIPLIGCKCEVCMSSDARDNRLRTSILVEDKGTTFVIDSGPDFRQQMLRHKVDKLDAILFTHEHKDHIAGLDEVRAYNFVSEKKMEVFASLQVQEALRREFAYIFADLDYPGIPQINLNTMDSDVFKIKSTTIIPIDVMHYKLPVKAFRMNDFTYITDANQLQQKRKRKSEVQKLSLLMP